MTQTLTHLPDARPLLLKALTTATRKPTADVVIPPLSVRVSGVRAEPALLDRYRDVCGFASSEFLPITYPQVLATSLHLWLMTRPEFPLPLLGLVHLRNKIEQPTGGLPADGVYGVVASVGPARKLPQGLIFDLKTEFTDAAGQVVYNAITTPLVRLKTGLQKNKSQPEPNTNGLADYREVRVPADTGRRYAAVSQDYNPIHLFPLTAKLFGFNRAIAHGMWSVAHCAALLEADLGAQPRQLQVQYKAPLLLPNKAVLKRSTAAGSHDFMLLAERGEKVFLTGSIR